MRGGPLIIPHRKIVHSRLNRLLPKVAVIGYGSVQAPFTASISAVTLTAATKLRMYKKMWGAECLKLAQKSKLTSLSVTLKPSDRPKNPVMQALMSVIKTVKLSCSDRMTSLQGTRVDNRICRMIVPVWVHAQDSKACLMSAYDHCTNGATIRQARTHTRTCRYEKTH